MPIWGWCYSAAHQGTKTPALLGCSVVCPTEITAFSDRHDEFKAVDTEVLGVSVDSQFSHLAWIQTDRKASVCEWGCLCVWGGGRSMCAE